MSTRKHDIGSGIIFYALPINVIKKKTQGVKNVIGNFKKKSLTLTK